MTAQNCDKPRGVFSMVKVVSTETMRQIESAANDDGISFDMMFDRVARVTAKHILDLIREQEDPAIAFLVGPGNNGNDALVTALQLAQQDTPISVGLYLVKPLAGDDPRLQAVTNADIFIANAEDDQQYRVLKNMVASTTIVVDAIFGIGMRLPLERDMRTLLRNVRQALNVEYPEPEDGILIGSDTVPQRRRPYVLALDCPSGIQCDTGEIDEATLPADETITFIAVKQGLILPPAIDVVGTLHVATLGIGDAYTDQESPDFAHPTQIQSLIPPRSGNSHKGTYGKALVVAGSVNYTGAAALAVSGAYRSGVGLTSLAAPMPVIAGVASQLMEPTWIMLPHDMGVISEKAVDILTKELTNYDALLIGPGLGQEDTTRDMLVKLLQEAEKPTNQTEKRAMGFAGLRQTQPQTNEDVTAKDDKTFTLPPLILDADALNLLAKQDNWYELVPENTIITPHPGEMARLCQLETAEVQSNRINITREKASEWGVIVLLKGAHTVIAAPNRSTTVLPFKTSALATAGTGDVLAGMIVGLLAQGVQPYESAIVGGYLHGLAGLKATDAVQSGRSVIASDILEMIGPAFAAIQ
jgi:NAD(P)H-hydrate repair Nnr-like enzyme with NAD(P)H-hydrate dehydratase domain/NAD(P)H-hydrate repair Nnr-like enzyme with NAD(P)H-hydrate epimerase domain